MQSNDFFLKIRILIIWLNKYDPGFHFWPELKHEWEGNVLENKGLNN